MKRNSRTYHDLKQSRKRVISNRGGTRSGKTYSIIQWLAEMAYYNMDSAPSVVTIARKTLPALKGSALRDFINILEGEGWYDEKQHNKSQNEYQLFNTLFEFIGTDQPQKVRGRKRNVLFCNEANELTREDFRQLSLRTTDRILLDYNPSMPESWIYTEVETRPDCDLFVTTYKDNPHLEESIISEIERYKDIDPDYWKIYGEGQIGQLQGVIYANWALCDGLPDDFQWRVFGLDFGFTNDPTALVEIRFAHGELWMHEHLYEKRQLNSDIARAIKRAYRNSYDREEVIADSAEPKSIEELNGYPDMNVHAAVKGADSVRQGIQLLKQYRMNVTKESINLQKELKNYKWKQDPNGQALNVPVDAFNHALDAVRYGVSYRLMNYANIDYSKLPVL